MLLIHQGFPVEPFLLDELPFLAAAGFDVTLLPTTNNASLPETFQGFPVSSALVRTRFGKILTLPLGSAFFCNSLSKEHVPQTRLSLLRLFHSSASVVYYRNRLAAYIKQRGLTQAPLVIYTYWFSAATYAAFLLKKHYPHIRVVTRAHGIDLFRERHPDGYLPLRKSCANWADSICACSAKGSERLREEGIETKRLRLSYLGVPVAKESATRPSGENRLSLVSCSRIHPVKRLDLLIVLIAALSRSRPDIHVSWTHIGGSGDELAALAARARQELAGCPNASHSFTGQLSKEGVRFFYADNAVDGLVNTSSSEGLPVSMMEAISAGIPIIGTDVGGVGEIVTETTGVLIPTNTGPTEFIKAANQLFAFKDAAKRQEIQQYYQRHFAAESNYPLFIREVLAPNMEKSAAVLKSRSHLITAPEQITETVVPL